MEFKKVVEKQDGEVLKATNQQLREYKATLKLFRQDVRDANTELKAQATVQKQVTATATKAVASTKKLGQAQTQLRSQVGASNAVALEFNRIIQDAPFGIVGVGNNLQQLTAQFSNLRAGGLTAGQAMKFRVDEFGESDQPSAAWCECCDSVMDSV